MDRDAVINEFSEERSGRLKTMEKFHSVEISLKGLDLPYQFKIWDVATESVGVLVKEESTILPFLNEGDALDMKHYSVDSTENILTVIQHITKNDHGRLKGHYLVGLRFIEAR